MDNFRTISAVTGKHFSVLYVYIFTAGLNGLYLLMWDRKGKSQQKVDIYIES